MHATSVQLMQLIVAPMHSPIRMAMLFPTIGTTVRQSQTQLRQIMTAMVLVMLAIRARISMEMELVIVPLATDADGREIVTFAFAPVADARDES